MRTAPVIILLLCCAALAADHVVNGRVHVSINGLTGAQALTLKSRVRGYYQDNETCRNWPGWQNVDWDVQTNSTPEGTRYDVSVVLAFASSNVAERVYSNLVYSNLVNRTTIPANVTSSVSIHYCPIDPTNTTGWRGCNIEPAARYREYQINP